MTEKLLNWYIYIRKHCKLLNRQSADLELDPVHTWVPHTISVSEYQHLWTVLITRVPISLVNKCFWLMFAIVAYGHDASSSGTEDLSSQWQLSVTSRSVVFNSVFIPQLPCNLDVHHRVRTAASFSWWEWESWNGSSALWAQSLQRQVRESNYSMHIWLNNMKMDYLISWKIRLLAHRRGSGIWAKALLYLGQCLTSEPCQCNRLLHQTCTEFFLFLKEEVCSHNLEFSYLFELVRFVSSA